MPPELKTVTIYGGGIAGAQLARRLMPDFEVTLVDPLDFFEVPMSMPRSLVLPAFADSAIFSFAEALPGARHLRARLVEWTDGGGQVEFDDGTTSLLGNAGVSVFTTGSGFVSPLVRAFGGTLIERKAFYRAFHDRLSASKRILIVGGGPIGVEVAGEISETYPDKALTLIEAGARILAGTSPKAAAYARRLLERRGVSIFTEERLIDRMPDNDVLASGGETRTSRDRTIAYDLLIWCTGGRPNTGYLQEKFPEMLNKKGQIRVDAYLQFLGTRRLFALGDITDLDENKMAWHINGQLDVADANIRAVANGLAPTRIYKPRTGDPRMAVTLGSRAGVIHLPPLGVIRTGWMVRAAKASHMLVPKYRKAFKLPAGRS